MEADARAESITPGCQTVVAIGQSAAANSSYPRRVRLGQAISGRRRPSRPLHSRRAVGVKQARSCGSDCGGPDLRQEGARRLCNLIFCGPPENACD